MKAPLFEEFESVSFEAWRECVERDLKGADFEKKLVHETLDGIALQPMYSPTDMPQKAGPLRIDRGWLTREDVRETDPMLARSHIEAATQRGADEVSVRIFPNDSVNLSAKHLGNLTAGIDPRKTAIHWLAGPLTRPTQKAWKDALVERGIEPGSVKGSVECDPITDRCSRWVDEPLSTWKTEFHESICCASRGFPAATWVTVRASIFEKAGASLAQELAWAVSILHAYLSNLPSEVSAQDLLDHAEIRFGVGTNYVLEICKLRVARILFANLAQLHGCTGVPKIHAVTTSSNKTIYDAHNNLLRATIESMAATIGGADSLTVAAYDQGYHCPDEFSEHLARNTTTLLATEAHLDKVADPLAGSYTVESLTRAYAEKAWSTFQQIEEQGGFARCFENGTIENALNEVREKRSRQIATRRRTIVGITQFANSMESKLAQVGASQAMFQAKPVPVNEENWTADWLMNKAVPSSALDLFRPSWPFENLRLRIESHVATGNRRPLIWLLLAGDLKMRNARAAFCQSFFAAGGYAIRQVVAEPLDAAVREALFENADAIVVCSADDEYGRLVEQIRVVAADTKLIVAGFPADKIDALREAGASDFVHVKTPQLEFLTQLHRDFGVAELLAEENS